MTLKEFIDELSSLGRVLGGSAKKWVKSGGIEGNYCPITAVCKKKTGKFFDVSDYAEAAKLLGLRKNIAKNIVKGADNNATQTRGYRTKLKRALSIKD